MMMMVMVIGVDEYINDNQGRNQRGAATMSQLPPPNAPKQKFKRHM
jgi:hypothetical protein